jgi:hypothetical protein
MEPNGGQVPCGVTEHGSPCGGLNFQVLETALAARFHLKSGVAGRVVSGRSAFRITDAGQENDLNEKAKSAAVASPLPVSCQAQRGLGTTVMSFALALYCCDIARAASVRRRRPRSLLRWSEAPRLQNSVFHSLSRFPYPVVSTPDMPLVVGRLAQEFENDCWGLLL